MAHLLDADLCDGPHLPAGPGLLPPELNVVQLEDVGIDLPPDVLEPLHDAHCHRKGQGEDHVANCD